MKQENTDVSMKIFRKHCCNGIKQGPIASRLVLLFIIMQQFCCFLQEIRLLCGFLGPL